MRCIVTGGAGYIGSHLAEKLLAQNHEVTILDSFYTGSLKNISHLIGRKHFELKIGCVLDRSIVEDLVKDSDIVFHLAAIVGVKNVTNNPLKTIIVNMSGSQNIFKLSYKYNRRVIFTSTSEVYGINPKTPFSEESQRVLGSTNIKRWAYSSAKSLAEHLGIAFYDIGLPITILRLSSCYGPRITTQGSVIARFIINALKEAPIIIHGNGEQTRPFTYVDDTVRGIIMASKNKKALGEIFNIGNKKSVNILKLAKLIKKITGSKSSIQFIRPEKEYGENFQDIKKRKIATSKALDILNFEAKVTLEKGLGKTVSWFKEEEKNISTL